MMVAASDDSFAIGCGYRCLTPFCATDRRIIATRYTGAGVRTHGYDYGRTPELTYLYACALSPDEKTVVLVGGSNIDILYVAVD